MTGCRGTDAIGAKRHEICSPGPSCPEMDAVAVVLEPGGDRWILQARHTAVSLRAIGNDHRIDMDAIFVDERKRRVCQPSFSNQPVTCRAPSSWVLAPPQPIRTRPSSMTLKSQPSKVPAVICRKSVCRAFHKFGSPRNFGAAATNSPSPK
jgi:hypothetical protein